MGLENYINDEDCWRNFHLILGEYCNETDLTIRNNILSYISELFYASDIKDSDKIQLDKYNLVHNVNDWGIFNPVEKYSVLYNIIKCNQIVNPEFSNSRNETILNEFLFADKGNDKFINFMKKLYNDSILHEKLHKPKNRYISIKIDDFCMNETEFKKQNEKLVNEKKILQESSLMSNAIIDQQKKELDEEKKNIKPN